MSICARQPGRMNRRASLPAMIAACVAIFLTGCNVDFAKIRREHAEKFPNELAAKTSLEITPGQSLNLDDCIRIALADNLDVQTSRIDRRLAELDRKIAFSNFLPHISVGINYHETGRQQAIKTAAGYSSTSDRAITDSVLSTQQNIFAPETWFLYDAYVKGEGVSELIARRTRDIIRLQVTTLYFACLSQEHRSEAIKASVEQAGEMLREVESLHREGLAMPSQVEQIRTLAMAQEANLAENQRTQRETRSALLEAMGLSPMAEIKLKRQTPLKVTERELADQILQAMLQRPELHISDRTIEIRKDETRMAIAQFLPKIAGFSDLSYNSNSYLKYANMWTFGVSGVLSVFDGFSNVFEYKAAKERQKQAGIDREQMCIKIMLEVIRARSQYEQALDQQRLARQELTAARTLLGETQAQWREGLLMTSERLEATARHITAQANASVAEFQVQVASATLLDVMGASPEGNNNEEVK